MTYIQPSVYPPASPRRKRLKSKLSGRMQISTVHPKRVDPTVARNAKYPQHQYLSEAVTNYTFEHAHSYTKITGALPGPLPASLKISRLILTSMLENINPAERSWANRSAHVFQKGSIYNTNHGEYAACFYELADLALDAMKTMLEEFDDLDWPFSVTIDNINRLILDVEDMKLRAKFDVDVPYLNIPLLIIMSLDMTLRMYSELEVKWAPKEINKFRVFLTYPTGDPESYNININYLFEYNSNGLVLQRAFLAGYRLGKVTTGIRRDGRPTAAINLRKVQITTLHFKRIPTTPTRPGFLCQVELCEPKHKSPP